MSVAGVIGYPTKKRPPPARKPKATASFPVERIRFEGLPSLAILKDEARMFELQYSKPRDNALRFA